LHNLFGFAFHNTAFLELPADFLDYSACVSTDGLIASAQNKNPS